MKKTSVKDFRVIIASKSSLISVDDFRRVNAFEDIDEIVKDFFRANVCVDDANLIMITAKLCLNDNRVLTKASKDFVVLIDSDVFDVDALRSKDCWIRSTVDVLAFIASLYFLINSSASSSSDIFLHSSNCDSYSFQRIKYSNSRRLICCLLISRSTS